MKSGLEAFHELKRETKGLFQEEFPIRQVDATDLVKLSVPDLVSEGYDELLAEEIVCALGKQNFVPLANSRASG